MIGNNFASVLIDNQCDRDAQWFAWECEDEGIEYDDAKCDDFLERVSIMTVSEGYEQYSAYKEAFKRVIERA